MLLGRIIRCDRLGVAEAFQVAREIFFGGNRSSRRAIPGDHRESAPFDGAADRTGCASSIGRLGRSPTPSRAWRSRSSRSTPSCAAPTCAQRVNAEAAAARRRRRRRSAACRFVALEGGNSARKRCRRGAPPRCASAAGRREHAEAAARRRSASPTAGKLHDCDRPNRWREFGSTTRTARAMLSEMAAEREQQSAAAAADALGVPRRLGRAGEARVQRAGAAHRDEGGVPRGERARGPTGGWSSSSSTRSAAARACGSPPSTGGSR